MHQLWFQHTPSRPLQLYRTEHTLLEAKHNTKSDTERSTDTKVDAALKTPNKNDVPLTRFGHLKCIQKLQNTDAFFLTIVVISKIIIARSSYFSFGIEEQQLAWPALCYSLVASTATRKGQQTPVSKIISYPAVIRLLSRENVAVSVLSYWKASLAVTFLVTQIFKLKCRNVLSKLHKTLPVLLSFVHTCSQKSQVINFYLNESRF